MSCVICGNELELIEAFSCGSTDCEYVTRTMNLGDEYVSQYIKSKPEIVNFLLQLGHYALNCKGLDDYQPCPIFIGETMKSSYQLLKTSMNSKCDFNKCWPDLQKLTNDQEIEKRYGLIIYGWIRFTLKMNLLNLSLDPTLKIPRVQIIKVEQFLEDVGTGSSSTSSVSSLDTQRLFFHGSYYVNWYSIINRGLKNYSGSKKMVHGAALGSGIYLASDSQLSMSYSGTNSSKMIMGVFEILGDCKQWNRGGVYVVSDETMVRIRYLLIGNDNTMRKCFQTINQMFSNTVVIEKKCQKQITSHIKNKRLLHEIKYFSQNDLSAQGIRCQFNDDNLQTWSVFLSKFEPKSELARGLAKIKDQSKMSDYENQIELEFRFPDQFPLKPPFVRIIRPRFEYRTGHITLGGSICLELLTNQGWNPTYSLENLIIHIKSVILEGEGRIDLKRWSEVYSYQEATEAFQRMLMSHGWK